jgi:hypothetical protein
MGNDKNLTGVRNSGAVIVADPNMILAQDKNLINGVLPVEDLRPYVSFKCFRRKEHLVQVNSNGNVSTESEGVSEEVHFLGFDETTKQFTVSYADNITGVEGSNVFPEGFGISDISVTHDANMMPLVDVTFVDVKGASLMAKGEDSPYSAIFDYPPPIFKLTMKGGFGMYVEYDLHMTKNDITFDSSTGNFLIKAKFIGEYFGPLTDILTGWLRAVPFLKNGVGADSISINDNSNDRENNVDSYFELIYRGSMLYAKINDYKQNSTDMAEHGRLMASDGEIDEIHKFIDSFTDTKSFASKIQGKELGKIKNIRIEKQDKISAYHSINPNGIKLVYSFPVVEVVNESAEGLSSVVGNSLQVETFKQFLKKELLDKLVSDFSIINSESDSYKVVLETAKNLKIEASIEGGDAKRNFITVDLSQYANEVLKAKVSINSFKKGTVSSITNNFKNMVRNILGIDPRIGNIFSVILKDFDFFMNKIKEAGETDKNIPSMASSGGATVLSKAPWPSVVKEKVYTSSSGSGASVQKQNVFIYPATQPEFKGWGECELVEEYCASLMQQKRTLRSMDKLTNQIDNNFYNPITPIEAFTSTDKTFSTNEYVFKDNQLEFVRTMLMRFLFMREYVYKGVFSTTSSTILDLNRLFTQEVLNKKNRVRLIKSLAKVEAQNAAYGLSSDSLRQLMKSWNYNELIKYLSDKNIRNVELIGPKNPSGSHDRYMITGYNSKYDTGTGREKGLANIIFRGDEFYQRNHSKFEGLMEITSKSDAIYGKLTEPKGEYSSDDSSSLNSDRMEVLKDHLQHSSWFFWKSENKAEEPILSNANTLLLPDVKAKNGIGNSDFFIESGIGNFLNERTLIRDLFQDILFDTNRWNGNDSDIFNRMLFKLYWLGTVKMPYNKYGDYNSELFGKFIQPATIEIPHMAIACLGHFLVSQDDKNYVSPKDYDKIVAQKTSLEVKFNKLIVSINSTKLGGFIKSDGTVDEEKYDAALDTFSEMSELKEMLLPVYLINNSVTTFVKKEHVLYDKGVGMYTLMKDGSVLNIKRDEETDETFKIYAEEFFTQLKTFIKEEDEATSAEDKDIEKQINDPDFKANIYYNFKTIYDRWLAGNGKWNSKTSTYDKFAFITRSHQNISDISVVDFQNLIDDARDGEVSVFTSIGKLLQENNFSFFPLNSYIDLTRDGAGESSEEAWRKSFELYTGYTPTATSSTKFVCMYVGGYSSQVDSDNANYPQDSVRLDMDTGKPSDFENSDDANHKVYAFKVRVGSQNQSIFTDFGLSTEEFKVTDESIKMHSDIIDAQAESNPIRKSQNLLNIYNQRSYTCSVTVPFGNLCIQPTQYFELEGINLFGGAYMIFNVQHAINSSSQRVETRFKGWRISHYVHPIIDDYVLSYLGLDSDITDNINQNGDMGMVNSNDGINNMSSGRMARVSHGNGNSHGIALSYELTGDNDDSYIQKYRSSSSIYKNSKLVFEEWIPENERAEFVLKVKAICYELGGDEFNPDWLMMVMYKESKFKPQIVNPSTNASGLIQVIPNTAIDITPKYNKLYRTKSNKIKKMTPQMIIGLGRVQQLNIVRTYLHRILEYRGINKLDSYWIINIGVFRPDSVRHYKNESTIMLKRGSIEYVKNKSFDPNGIGYVTIGMYKNAIKKALVRGGIPKDVVLGLA